MLPKDEKEEEDNKMWNWLPGLNVRIWTFNKTVCISSFLKNKNKNFNNNVEEIFSLFLMLEIRAF